MSCYSVLLCVHVLFGGLVRGRGWGGGGGPHVQRVAEGRDGLPHELSHLWDAERSAGPAPDCRSCMMGVHQTSAARCSGASGVTAVRCGCQGRPRRSGKLLPPLLPINRNTLNQSLSVVNVRSVEGVFHYFFLPLCPVHDSIFPSACRSTFIRQI